jgi:Glycosyl hydrolases family 35
VSGKERMASHHTVEFSEHGLRVEGERLPLVSAEFHFWRVQAMFWPRTLDAVREAGNRLVSTFVCWDFHELAPGDYDFTGRTTAERDLGRFLDLCAERDLKVILRPGPIIDAEWETRGPAKDVCTLERNDPRFRVRAAQWLEAIGQFAAGRQHPAGPIALVAADNELYFPYASDPAWHDEDGDVFIAYKREFAEARYRDWLVRRHGTVQALNHALGTAHESIATVPVPRYAIATPAEVQESFRFIDDYCTEYMEFVTGALRDAGISVPVYTNQKQFLAYLDWDRAGSGLESVGVNLCMPNLVPGAQALAVSWFLRLQRARPGFPWSPEYQAGWIGFDEMYGVISPEHGLYMGTLGAALGLRGMSFFMFVERDDWNWSPLNSFGKVRPTRYEAYRRLCGVMAGLRPDALMADVGLLWSLRDHRAHVARGVEGWEDLFKYWMLLDAPKEAATWWSVFAALHESDADFVLTDTRRDPETWPPVFVHAGEEPEDAALASMERALQSGRTLVSAGRLDRGQRARLARAGTVVDADPSGVWSAALRAGAATYLASGGGLWSFAYADLEGPGRTAMFVNTGTSAARIAATGTIADAGSRWRELVTERAGDGNVAAAVRELGGWLPPKASYVLRLDD